MLLLTINYFAASLDCSLHGEPMFLRVNPHSKPTQANGKAEWASRAADDY